MSTKVVLGLLGLGAIVAAVTNSGDKVPRPPPDPKVVAESKAESARMALAREFGRAIKAPLRDPDSLKFGILVVNQNATTACAQYQAKNGFGGMNQAAAIVADGKAVAFSVSAWKKHCVGLLDYLSSAPQ